jgi:3-deoxy-D-manno-octulosonic-acid transferase
MNIWYSAVSTLAIFPLSIYSLFDPDLRPGLRLRYRPGAITAPDAAVRLWVHAASAGEVRLAEAFAGRVLERRW